MRLFLVLLNLMYVIYAGLAVARAESKEIKNSIDLSACSLTSAQVFEYPVKGLPYASQLLSMSSSYGWDGAVSTLSVKDNVVQTTGTISMYLRDTFSEDWGTLAIPVCHDSFIPANQNGGNVTVTNGEVSVGVGGIDYLGGYHTIGGLAWRYVSAQTLIDAGFREGDEVTVKIKNSTKAPYSSYTGWGKLIKRAQGVPTLVLTFDDGGTGPWEQLDYSRDKGIKGTIFYPWDYEGRKNKMTVEQLQDMKEAGWDIELNGTGDDSSMTLAPTAKKAVSSLLEGRAWLAKNGLNDNAQFFAYPNGNYDSYSRAVVRSDISGQTGSTVVKTKSVSGIKVGMVAEGRSFPKGTRVVKVNKRKKRVVLDHASRGVGRGGEPIDQPNKYMTFTDDSSEFFTWKLQKRLKQAGFKIGRTTRPNTMYSRYCVGDYGLVAPSRGSVLKSGDDPVERIEYWIDEVQKAGTTTVLYFHDITGSQDGINTSINTYQMWIDKLAEARDEGKIEVLTMKEWYDRDCGSGES
ncbi:polysaccharide deacetylase family protein [Vibrio sp. AK197]